MSEHVILLNSGKTDAYCHLVKFVPGDRVDVITGRKYTPLYPHDANLHYVHDIADVTEGTGRREEAGFLQTHHCGIAEL
nr:hypothetical protein [Bifidobacterium catenulatum]